MDTSGEIYQRTCEIKEFKDLFVLAFPHTEILPPPREEVMHPQRNIRRTR
jgi:hypothetical protein